MDVLVDKKLENSKRWLICVYLRGREVREVERKKASLHRAVSRRREGRYDLYMSMYGSRSLSRNLPVPSFCGVTLATTKRGLRVHPILSDTMIF